MNFFDIFDAYDLLVSTSNWLIQQASLRPKLFTFIFFILLILSALELRNAYLLVRKYLENRNLLFEAIRGSRRQAVAHQRTDHPVDHALEPHKQQKAQAIEEAYSRLPKFIPLRKSAENLVQDLRSANSFEQSEKIASRFLKNHKKDF